MNRFSLIACITLATLATSGAAFAQGANGNTAGSTQSSVSGAGKVTPPVDPLRTRTVKELIRRIQDGAGTEVRIVADSSIIDERAPLPTEATTPENFEAQIAALVQQLPAGTTWAKLYLPSPETTHNYKGDDLAEFALAESKLFGKIGAAPAGSVEVMGKIMSADKAQAVVDTLNLKPVYLITNPTAKAVGAGDINAWSSMTDDQKKDYAKNEAQKRLSMGPDAFAQNFGNFFGQQMSIMGQMFGMMSPEQRQQYGQAMMSQMQNSGAMNMMFMPRGGAGGGGAAKP